VLSRHKAQEGSTSDTCSPARLITCQHLPVSTPVNTCIGQLPKQSAHYGTDKSKCVHFTSAMLGILWPICKVFFVPYLIRSTLPNPSVCWQKIFRFALNLACWQRLMCDTWRYAVWPDSRSKSRSPKVAKMADFKVSSPLPVIKRLTVNYYILKDNISFFVNRFLTFVLVLRHVTFKFRVFRQTFASFKELTGSPVRGLLFSCACFWVLFDVSSVLHLAIGVPRRQPHRRSGLATLPYVGAVP